MLTPLAFLDVGGGSVAVVEGRLDPVDRPAPATAAFFAPDFGFSEREARWFQAPGHDPRLLSRSEWARRFPPQGERALVLDWDEPEEARFRAAFDTLRSRLSSGELRKGVPITRMSAPLPPDRAEALFHTLVTRVPQLPATLMPYGFFLPAAGGRGAEFLIGATPELLFDLEDGHRLSTVAVAGTRLAEEGASLEGDAKERDEHGVVVDDLLEQLSRWGDARTSRTAVHRFGQLAHLVADIEVKSRGLLDFEVVARCLHPTPALGVYPRNAVGATWLAESDPLNERRRFGAPFGLRGPTGSGRALVAIRNLQYAEGRIEIWAGCGVVTMSRYDEEWREVLQKMQSVRELWGV